MKIKSNLNNLTVEFVLSLIFHLEQLEKEEKDYNLGFIVENGVIYIGE